MSQDWLVRPVTATPRQALPIRRQEGPAASPAANSFQAELNKRLHSSNEKITFSAHAMERLRNRNIRLSQDDLKRIEHAIDKAAAKGGRESLVVYKDVAFVVSVKNRTVITAVDSAHMNDHVFTQIDSAVFA